MNELNLYEKKVISDKDFPVQIFRNKITTLGEYCAPHWHEHIEMHYFFSGEAQFRLGQNHIPIKEQDLIIVNSSEIHGVVSKNKHVDSLVLIFDIGAFSKELEEFHVIFESLIQGDKRIYHYFQEIFQEMTIQNPGYKLAVKGRIYELITYLYRNHVTKSLSLTQGKRHLRLMQDLNEVMDYMQKHFADTIPNGMLAEMIHLSEGRFLHVFKEYTGLSPQNYLNEIRLNKAHNLLSKTDMTVTETANLVGITDLNNFGRLFKKYYGYVPSSVWKQNS